MEALTEQLKDPSTWNAKLLAQLAQLRVEEALPPSVCRRKSTLAAEEAVPKNTPNSRSRSPTMPTSLPQSPQPISPMNAGKEAFGSFASSLGLNDALAYKLPAQTPPTTPAVRARPGSVKCIQTEGLPQKLVERLQRMEQQGSADALQVWGVVACGAGWHGRAFGVGWARGVPILWGLDTNSCEGAAPCHAPLTNGLPIHRSVGSAPIQSRFTAGHPEMAPGMAKLLFLFGLALGEAEPPLVPETLTPVPHLSHPTMTRMFVCVCGVAVCVHVLLCSPVQCRWPLRPRTQSRPSPLVRPSASSKSGMWGSGAPGLRAADGQRRLPAGQFFFQPIGSRDFQFRRRWSLISSAGGGVLGKVQTTQCGGHFGKFIGANPILDPVTWWRRKRAASRKGGVRGLAWDRGHMLGGPTAECAANGTR